MSTSHRLLSLALALGLASGAGTAHAALEKWDQAQVTALANQLVDAAQALQDTFQKQPPPTVGSGQSRDYYRLKQVTRHLRQEAAQLAGDLGKGAGMEETLPGYEDLMSSVRDAREIGARIFATQDIKDKATAARLILNRLAPYYDPDAVPLEPVQR
jgi:hypothetical protein